MNQLRNPDGQLLLDFGEENKNVYYSFGADGLYDALTMGNKDLVSEMEELYSMYDGLSVDKVDGNSPIAKRFVVFSDKYINKNPDLYREFASGKKICSEFYKFIREPIDIKTISQLSCNQVFSAHIDQKIEDIYTIKHQENIDTTSEIFEMIKQLNKDLLNKTISDSIQIYSNKYLKDSLLTKDLIKFKEYRNEEKFEMDDIFVGNVDQNFSKLFSSFFSDELEKFSEKQTDVQASEDSIFTHFFTFVLSDVLNKLQEYVVLYKDKINISDLTSILEDMRKNFIRRKNTLSAKK